MTKSVKFLRKDQSVKGFTSKCLFFTTLANFVYFPCISDRNPIILFKFTWNYPAYKIDQLPLLRILSLCMDHSVLTGINSL